MTEFMSLMNMQIQAVHRQKNHLVIILIVTLYLLWRLLIYISVSGCIASSTKVTGKTVCKGHIIFEDNFDQLDTSKWQKQIRFNREPDYEFVIYNETPETYSINNGILKITPTKTEDFYGSDSLRDNLTLGNALVQGYIITCL